MNCFCMTCCPCGSLDTKALKTKKGYIISCQRCDRRTKFHNDPNDAIAEWEKMCEEYYDNEESEEE